MYLAQIHIITQRRIGLPNQLGVSPMTSALQIENMEILDLEIMNTEYTQQTVLSILNVQSQKLILRKIGQ